MPLHTPTHPYPAVFTSQDGLVNHFTYLFQIKGQGRILFFGRMDNIEICIKFTTHYCKEAHEFLAAQGFALKLHAVERLPGGLYMIIMDDVSKQYISLFDLIRDRPELLLKEYLDTRNTLLKNVRQCLQQFHQTGFVHGDFHDTNVMVKTPEGDDAIDFSSFLVIYFDSSNKEVRYPLDLNTTDVWWPEGATGSAVIEVDHDLDMLDHIWDP